MYRGVFIIFLLAVIKHHDQTSLQKEGFMIPEG